MELAAAPAAPETLQPPQPDYEASKPKKEDYTDDKEYRRDYKRWHTFKTRGQQRDFKRQRELDENSCLQSVLDAEPDQPRFKKPRGRAPLADGVPCTWDHTVPLGLEGRSKFKELLAAGAPRHPIGRFRPRRPGGSGTFSNFELWAPEVAFRTFGGFGPKFPRRAPRAVRRPR